MSLLKTKDESNIQQPPRLHVVVATFPAFGHIIPMLGLSKKMAKFHNVTFVVSESKVAELTKRELIKTTDTVRIHGLKDGVVDDFDNPTDHSAMTRVFQGVLPAMAQLFSGTWENFDTPADVVIVDNFLGGPAAICFAKDIPYYLFNCANAILTQLLLCMNEDAPIMKPEDAEPFMRLPKPGEILPLPAEMKALFMPLRNTMHLATGVIINSFRDIELDALNEIEKNPTMANLTIHCVGPLLPEVTSPTTNSANHANEEKVKEWLDKQTANTVAYVSFGSVATPTPEQIKIIGQALLAIGHPFIWSMREKYYEFLPEELRPAKIDGSEKFMIVPWAPQKMILEHPSVGVFMSHCGWNSTLEGLSGGKAIVAWPMFADQMLNGQWVVKLDAGVLIPTTGMKCPRIIPAEEIQEAIESASGWKDGGEEVSAYRESAENWAEKIRNTWREGGSSYKEFMDLIRFKPKA